MYPHPDDTPPLGALVAYRVPGTRVALAGVITATQITIPESIDPQHPLRLSGPKHVHIKVFGLGTPSREGLTQPALHQYPVEDRVVHDVPHESVKGGAHEWAHAPYLGMPPASLAGSGLDVATYREYQERYGT
jgi:hypothetical protein